MLAPTGTIGLLMDCDTTGIEPDFALVKFKKLAGGGYFKIVNQSVPEALRAARLRRAEVQEIVAYVSGTNTLLARAARQPRDRSRARASTDEDLAKVEAAIPGVFDLELAFAPWVLGDEALRPARRRRRASARRPASRCSRHLGFTRERDRGGQRRHRRPHDGRGRAAPARPSTTRCSTAPTAAARRARASSRRCRTSG